MADTFTRNQNTSIMAALTAGTRKMAPIASSTGKPTFNGSSSQLTLGNGRSQPPQKSVTATPATTKMLAYSARKYSDHRNPLYSVWKPATISDSASGRSNGARLVSAVAAIIYTTNGTIMNA